MVRKSLATIGLIGFIILLGVVLDLFWGRDKKITQKDLLLSGVQVAVQDLRFSRGCNGTRQWLIKAKEGFILQGGQNLDIRDIDFSFVASDGQVVSGSAPWGRYRKGSDLILGDNVKLKWAGWQLAAVRMRYWQDRRLLSFQQGVVAQGKGMVLKSKEAFIDIDKQELQCLGGVEIFFNG